MSRLTAGQQTSQRQDWAKHREENTRSGRARVWGAGEQESSGDNGGPGWSLVHAGKECSLGVPVHLPPGQGHIF